MLLWDHVIVVTVAHASINLQCVKPGLRTLVHVPVLSFAVVECGASRVSDIGC